MTSASVDGAGVVDFVGNTVTVLTQRTAAVDEDRKKIQSSPRDMKLSCMTGKKYRDTGTHVSNTIYTSLRLQLKSCTSFQMKKPY